MNKLQKLKDYIKNLNKVMLAFSGGVDSAFLLKICHDILGENLTAITINSPYVPNSEIEEAKKITSDLRVKHIIIDIPILEEIKNNPQNKCYICKKFMFQKIFEEAKKLDIHSVLDGTNFDDLKDYRPGFKVLREFYIKSPLLELGFRKKEIRLISKELNLFTWDKPAYSCLLSRLEVGTEITLEKLHRIEMSEIYMNSLGLKGIRVRSHGDLARIEVQPKDRIRLFDLSLLDKISIKLKEFGFKYVTLDLQGYKTGSLN